MPSFHNYYLPNVHNQTKENTQRMLPCLQFFSCMDTHHLLSLNTAKYKTAQCLANKRREGRILYYNMIVHICFSGCFLCDRCHDSECFHKTMSCDSSEDPNRRRCRTTECESLKKHNKQIIRRGSASHADESNLTNAELTCETLRLLWVEIKGLSPSVFVQELPVL